MTKGIILVLFLISVIIALLAIYGGVQVYSRPERIGMAESQKIKIASLELKVWELRRINDLVLVLEQILTPRQIDEFEAANERIKQKKHREYERHEQPLITEKERG